MLRGTLVAESLKTGAVFDARRLGVQRLRRHSPFHTASYQPESWTNIEFEVAETEVDALANGLADVLDQPGWYVFLSSGSEVIVVFPGRVFRFSHDDHVGRSEAQRFGRRVGVPGYQLDWPV